MNKWMLMSASLSLVLATMTAVAEIPSRDQAPLLEDVGDNTMLVETPSPLATRYFRQGMQLFYAFDDAESIRSFRQAVWEDPECVLCYWGLALALGSKDNTPLNGYELTQAKAAINQAQWLINHRIIPMLPQSKKEAALVQALSLRYPAVAAAAPMAAGEGCHGTALVEPTAALAYANAMRALTVTYPNDANIKNLYVAALIDAYNWVLTTPKNELSREGVHALAVLDEALALEPNNAGAHHYRIHLLEQTQQPEKAQPNADFLRSAVPGAGHLLHMPSHIDRLLGNYQAGVLANLASIDAFEQYDVTVREQGFKPAINFQYQHSVQALWFLAMLQGRSQLALASAQQLALMTPVDLAEQNQLGAFLIAEYLTNVRFGAWKTILQLPPPASRLPVVVGSWHYARGMAFAQTQQPVLAQREATKLATQWKAAIMTGAPVLDRQRLAIAQSVLAATMALKAGDRAAVMSHWQKAIDLESAMLRTEPPGWYFSTRQGFGYALLALKEPTLAEKWFREDLTIYPENGWSLFGLARSLTAQGKLAAAVPIDERFKSAWSFADVKLDAAWN